jgi:hypothetical protein
MKPSQTTTSAWPLNRSRPSTLPMKRKGLAGELVALGLFFADGEQAHARVADLEHAAGIHFAHDGELFEIVRFAVHVGAHVEQHAGASRGTGHGGSQGRAVNAGHGAEHHFGRGHGRAGVASGDKADSRTFAHEFKPHAHGAIALGADGVRRLLVHADAFGGMVDDDGQVFVFEVLVEQIAQFRLRPNEMHAHRQGTAGEDRPMNLGFRSFV